MSQRLAAALKALGVEEGERVAALSLNQDRYIEFYLAVAWAGAVSCRSTFAGARGKRGRSRDCRPNALIVDAAFAPIGLGSPRK